jgi:hypothetical protein
MAAKIKTGKFGVKATQRAHYVCGISTVLYVYQLPCKICGMLKPYTEFCVKKNTLTGLQSHCRDCMNRLARERWWDEEKRQSNLLRKNIASKKANTKNREHVLNLLGGQCSCCHERDYKVLEIHHKKGGGNQHRRDLKFQNITQFLKKHPNKISYFQLLCANCHRSLEDYKYCPHTVNNLDNFIDRLDKIQFERFLYKIDLYGEYDFTCSVCGIQQIEFFELNHIDNPKSCKYQNMPRKAWTLFHHLLNHGFDKNLFNLMCANCHTKFHKEGNTGE